MFECFRRLTRTSLFNLIGEALAFAKINPIRIENAKQGTDEWQLSSPALDHEIEGYASLTSVNRGGTVSLFVSTTDPAYTIDIYRMGWYAGLGARKIAGPIDRQGIHQTNQSFDPATGFVECDWVDPCVLRIPPNRSNPTDWPSGVYLAKLTGSTSKKQSYIIFVVRDDERRSDILFQSSVTTFQAYNEWGAHSLYTKPGSDVKVSFNRPYRYTESNDPAYLSFRIRYGNGQGAGEFLTPLSTSTPGAWEYNMVRFLEREGYDVTYITNVDTHDNATLLLLHKAFLSVGHDEYWSWEMRDHVEAARDHGVGLGFFSANTSYWQVRFEPSTATGAPNRTMVCYKDANLDPVAQGTNARLATGRWRDAPISRSEDSMIGVMTGFLTADGDYVIEDAVPWLLRGTGLAKGDRLRGLVGYEADALFAGSAPSNVQIVGSSPVQTDPDRVLAGAGSTSNSTVYEVESGATVFASGSIRWSLGLDDYNSDPTVGPVLHSSYLDSRVQQMTRNVLERLISGRERQCKCPLFRLINRRFICRLRGSMR